MPIIVARDQLDLGFGAMDAEGDPKPQMSNKGFGAMDAEGDPKPQMFNKDWGEGQRKRTQNPKCNKLELVLEAD